MGHAVKISDTEMVAVRDAAAVNSRSISGQAEHWIRLGRAVERNPEFGFLKIERALKGLASVDDLTGAEQEEFFDRFADQSREPSAQEEAFWAERRRLGLGVGMDEAGNLVHSHSAPLRAAEHG